MRNIFESTGFEQLTGVAGHIVRLSSSFYSHATKGNAVEATVTTMGAGRFRYDGGVPTATVGHPFGDGTQLHLTEDELCRCAFYCTDAAEISATYTYRKTQ